MDTRDLTAAGSVYSRAPAYSPFRNPAHVDDTFGYLADMYGPALVEGLAGPDAFLAHQMPGQALSDQYAASKYQRQSAQSVAAANTRGNDAVARKLLGIQSLMTGGAPVTQLDRENADVGAAVINNPIFKQFAASQIGAENLEALMFGRRGDPTAMAAAANRIGFYRQDAVGNRRMSAESTQQFSAEMYENMFGENANVNEMRGFGAVAAGELAENLFQRGKLPQSMGSMSAAERVKLISGSQRDDKTMDRLADEFSHRDLMERDTDYANATAQEQKIIREDKRGEYRDRLSNTFTEIDKYRANDPKAKSAEEIEQLEGYGLAANATDAQRTSKTLKEYTGALATVREIFGDSGRADAPIQELLASLEQLSGGSAMNVSPGRMQQLLSGVRLAARETGRDLSALTAGMEESMAIGAQYGIRGSEVLSGESNRMHTAQALADQGVYDKEAFGKLNRGQLERRQKELSIRGDASGVSRMLATMNRLVSENPDMYKGTKMEAAMKAYQQGESTFEYQGQKINLAEMAGREGVQGLRALAEESGAEQSHVFAYMNDKSTDEYRTAGYAYKAQAYELQRNVSRRNEHRMRSALSSEEFTRANKPMFMSDEEFKNKNNDLARGFSYAITGIVMDETDGMSAEERSAHIEKRGKEELVKYFKSDRGGSMNQRQAEAASEQYFSAMYGDDPNKRKANINAAYAEISGVTQQRTGENIEAAKQLYNKKAQDVATDRVQQDARRAERQTEVTKASGTESTFLQRVGDELDSLGSGSTTTQNEALSRIFNVASKDEMLQKYAPEMQAGLVAAAQMRNEAIITPEKIQALSEQAAKNPTGAAARQLKELAGYKQDQKLTEEEQTGLVDRATRKSAYTAAGKTPEERARNEEKISRSNIIFKAYNTGAKEDIAAASRSLAQEMLGPDAGKEKIAAFADAVASGDQKAIDAQMAGGFFGGGLTKEQKQRTLEITEALQDARKMGGLEKAGFAQDATTVTQNRERPSGQMYDYKQAVNARIRETVNPMTDNRAFNKLKPAEMSQDEFDAKKLEAVKTTSRIMTNIVTDEMGLGELLTPDARAEMMQKRATEEMTKHFEATGMPAEKARAQAEKQLSAMFGSDKRDVQQNMERMYQAGRDVAKERGVAPPTAEQLAARPAIDVAPEARETPPAAAKKYDYQQLGVPEQATNAQRKLMAEVARDPHGGELAAAMRDTEKRKLLLTLPDEEAVALFDKMTPEAQKKGLAEMAAFKDSFASRMLPQAQQQNLERLHTVISEQRSQKGLSSSNVVAAPEHGDLRLTGPAAADFSAVRGFDAAERVGGEMPSTPVSSIAEMALAPLGPDFARGMQDVLSTPVNSAGLDMSRIRGITAVAPSAGGKTDSSVNISGTLVLQGLSEAVMQASGRRMEDTPDGGVPIDLGGATNSYAGR
jgi:hypothetical protein